MNNNKAFHAQNATLGNTSSNKLDNYELLQH